MKSVDLVKLSQELSQHGLKTDNYGAVSRFCSHHAASMRKQAGHLYVKDDGNGTKNSKRTKRTRHAPVVFQFKPMSKGPKSMAYHLYFGLKLWAQIQTLMAESRSVPRKRHHIRKLARKLVTHADSMPKGVLSVWLRAFALYALNDYAMAKHCFESVWAALPEDVRLLAPWKSTETLIRFCDYQLKKDGQGGVLEPLMRLEYASDGSGARMSVDYKQSIIVHGYSFELTDRQSCKALKTNQLDKLGAIPEELAQFLQIVTEIKSGKQSIVGIPDRFGNLKLYQSMCQLKPVLDYRGVLKHLRRGVQLFDVQQTLTAHWSPFKYLGINPSLLVPCKPVVFDLALDHIDLSLTSGEGKGPSMLRGWFAK